jgi:ATP-binding cassette subfamily F protein 3
VAFVGKNGEGKSTLVKCIMNEIGYDGNLKIGHNVKIGYFAQNQAQLLDGEITVFDTIDRVAVGDIRTKIRDILGAFMFGGEASDKKVKVLSGGEKTRLAMIKLLLEPVNLLILDEPTNHLDMRTKDVLKQAIKDFDGTVIVVSHDREFLDGLVEKVYEFGGGKVRECLGGIYEFLEKKKLDSLQQLELTERGTPKQKAGEYEKVKEGLQQKQVNIQPNGGDKSSANAPKSKINYFEQREHEKAIKRANKKVAEAEAEISRLEDEVKLVEAKIADGDVSTAVFDEHAAATRRLEDAMSLWELACQELEQLQNK